MSNTSKTISSYKSDINIWGNTFRDFEKAVYLFNSTITLDNNFFSEGHLNYFLQRYNYYFLKCRCLL